jgi:ureidoglycolate dehydrogenase (NAD+)
MIPEGWALDEDGNPTTDPQLAAILLPFGGPKGSGLALMFECLASLMAGNPLLGPALEAKQKVRRSGRQNSVVAAINIGTFTDPESYKANVDQVIDGIKDLPRAEGTDEVFVPGEPENRVYQKRVREGIPLPAGTVRKIRAVAERLGIEPPSPL